MARIGHNENMLIAFIQSAAEFHKLNFIVHQKSQRERGGGTGGREGANMSRYVVGNAFG